MKPGWACDNNAGIYFEDNDARRIVATRAGAKVYYVSVVNGTVVEKPFVPETIALRRTLRFSRGWRTLPAPCPSRVP